MNQSKLLPTIILSLVAFAIQPNADAQGNLVNFYDWTTTEISYQTTPLLISNIFTSKSPDENFDGGSFSYNNVTANLDTTPGANYEISFTMRTAGPSYLGDPTMSFGSYSVNCGLLPGGQLNGGADYPPVNFDFTVVATDPITPMSFTVFVDTNQGISLSDVSVVEVPVLPVPEASTTALLTFGGCVLMLMRQWRRTAQKKENKGSAAPIGL